MNDEANKPPEPNPNPPGDAPKVESFSHSPVAARVPEKIARGTFCTGQVILDGPREFMLDFLQGLTRPFQVVSRVVLNPQTAVEFAAGLQRSIEAYSRAFGTPAPVPQPPNQRRPTLQEIYENFRISDEMLSGIYANTSMITFSATEFVFDFITSFYPTSAVAARIFIPAPQAPRFLNSLNASIQQHRQRFGPLPEPQPQPQQQPPPQPPAEPAPPGEPNQ